MGNQQTKAQETMSAYVRESTLTYRTDYPQPDTKLEPDQVCLRILAAAINPADYKAPKIFIGPVVGLDVCGIVASAGQDSPFPVGTRVYGTARGTLAQYVVCKHTSLGKTPDVLSNVHAAAMPTTYLTSLQALRDHGSLPNEGGKLLIIGASGGCGLAAVQLARRMNAETIVGVCSGKNKDIVLGNGAHRVIDYTVNNFWEDDGAKYDVVYDTATNSGAGEDYKGHAVSVLHKKERHGQYVAINGGTSMWLRKFTCGVPSNQHLFLTHANTKDMNEISRFVNEGMRPVIQKEMTFTAEHVEEGFLMLKSRRTVGKIVFVMVPVL
jgi:NADPH:quinone reductase-like Zn-dependent oxidoreductase